MKLKTLGIAAIILLLVALAAALIVPSLVEDAVEDELRTRLGAIGVDAEWDSFSSTLGRGFQMRDLRLEMPSRGVSAEIDSLLVSVSLVSVFEQTVSIEGVDVQGARVRVDLAQLDGDPGEDGSQPAGQRMGSTNALKESLGRFIEQPPDVKVRESSISVFRGNTQLAVASTTESTLSLGWSEVAMQGDLQLEALDASVSRWLRPTSAVLDATWVTKTGALSASLKSPESGRPLISWEDPQLGALRVAAVGLVANTLKREARASVELVSIRIGDGDVPAFSLEAPSLELSYKQGRPAVLSKGARLVVAPSKRGDIMRLLRPGDVKPKVEKTSKTPGWSRRSQRIQALLNKGDFAFKDLQLDLQIADDDEQWTRLTLVESLSGFAKSGHFGATGSTAGGTFGLEVDLLPGDLIPRYLSIDIKDVDLENIPGMPKGRSELPSRGTSGRVGGVFSANLQFQTPPKGAFLSQLYEAAEGELSVQWTKGVVDLVGLSDEPLTGIEFSTKASFRLNPKLDRMEVVNGHVDWGAIDVEYHGYLEDMMMDPTVFLRAEMSEIECQRAFRSLPAGMLGPYRKMEFEGKWAPSVEFYLPTWRPRALRLDFDGYEDLCDPTDMNVPKSMRPEFVEVRSVAPTGPHRFAGEDGFTGPILSDVFWLNRPFVKRVIEGVSSEEVVVSVGPGLPTYVPIETLPAWVGGAAYLSEEILFYTGDGISLGLIKKALRLNLEKGRFVYGGSTVTQQLVKNLFLTRDKTLSRKLQEALISWRITDQISKDRVLELYLNCIEFGPDIYGIGPAAQYYFQKNARDLSPLEAVFLAMLKPNPLYGARVIQRRKTPQGGWWSNRMDEMFQRLLDRGLIRPEDVEGQKPYVLEWDAKGRYVDRQKLIPLLPL